MSRRPWRGLARRRGGARSAPVAARMGTEQPSTSRAARRARKRRRSSASAAQARGPMVHTPNRDRWDQGFTLATRHQSIKSIETRVRRLCLSSKFLFVEAGERTSLVDRTCKPYHQDRDARSGRSSYCQGGRRLGAHRWRDGWCRHGERRPRAADLLRLQPRRHPVAAYSCK